MTVFSEHMRALQRRARRRQRLLLVTVWVALPTLMGCKKGGATQPPTELGDFRDIEPEHVDAAFRADWDALQRARERDPGSEEVARRVDALLRRGPPLALRLTALLAKAEQAYLSGNDAQAVQVVDQALSAVPASSRRADRVLVALSVVRIRAMVRGGDPARALVSLAEPILAAVGGLEPSERIALEAVALDRADQGLDAAVAFAKWRSVLGEDDPAAAYAEERFALRTARVDRDQLWALAEPLPPSTARRCIEVRLGMVQPAARDPVWVADCGASARRVGVLLPRTGPLSALADIQLAAAAVAVRVLTEDDATTRVLWRDAGSTPDTAVGAARSLIAAGADVVVGPVGPANVRAVVEQVGDRVDIVLPGEGTTGAVGVAPSLETRVVRLVKHARGMRATRFIVAAPDNAYGRRAVKALRAALEPGEADKLIVQIYPSQTTSFAPVLAPMLPALHRGAALLIPDHISRVELLVRQLARSGKPPTAADGPLVLSTVEGTQAESLGPGHEVLTGLWVAPVAAESAATRRFVEAYTEAQGEPPGDQALLVYYALQQALTGAVVDAKAVLRIEAGQGGRLVPASAPKG